MKTATLIQSNLPGYIGEAHLYELSEPIEFNKPFFEDDPPAKETSFVVVSAAYACRIPETYIFASNKEGEIIYWGELEGSFQGGMDHKAALEGAGYKVQQATSTHQTLADTNLHVLFQGPYKLDEYCPIYIHGHTGWLRIISANLDYPDYEKVLSFVTNRLNNIEDDSVKGEFTFNESAEFFLDGEYIFDVRGWGALTGGNGYRLSEQKASEEMDKFAEFIYSKIS